MNHPRRDQLVQRLGRAREVLYVTEREAARHRREILPSYDVPVIGERVHQALDWINAWVGEARVLHQLAERELAQFMEGSETRTGGHR